MKIRLRLTRGKKIFEHPLLWNVENYRLIGPNGPLARIFWRKYIQSPYFKTLMEPRNRFQGMNSASLWSLAGRYDNPIPPRFLAPIDYLKFQLSIVCVFCHWESCSQIHSHWLGDKVYYGIGGLSSRPSSLCILAGRYNIPMSESQLYPPPPLSGTMNLATSLKKSNFCSTHFSAHYYRAISKYLQMLLKKERKDFFRFHRKQNKYKSFVHFSTYMKNILF